MTVKERIILFVKSQKISNSEFCRTIGVSNAFISSMRVSLQPDKIESIALNYPQLNTHWLLTGEGEMLKKDSYNPINNKSMEPQAVEIELRERISFLENQLSEKDKLIEFFMDQVRSLTTGTQENKKKEVV